MQQYCHTPCTPSWRAQGQLEQYCEYLAVWPARANSATEVPDLLEVNIMGLIKTDTADGVSVWIGLSWTKL
jgi:hypothetical protein